jgi:hypothetical protein
MQVGKWPLYWLLISRISETLLILFHASWKIVLTFDKWPLYWLLISRVSATLLILFLPSKIYLWLVYCAKFPLVSSNWRLGGIIIK